MPASCHCTSVSPAVQARASPTCFSTCCLNVPLSLPVSCPSHPEHCSNFCCCCKKPLFASALNFARSEGLRHKLDVKPMIATSPSSECRCDSRRAHVNGKSQTQLQPRRIKVSNYSNFGLGCLPSSLPRVILPCRVCTSINDIILLVLRNCSLVAMMLIPNTLLHHLDC